MTPQSSPQMNDAGDFAVLDECPDDVVPNGGDGAGVDVDQA